MDNSESISARDRQIETWERVKQIRKIEDQAIYDDSGRMFWSVITVGQGASRAIFILCGGGAAAMLTFLGQVFSQSKSALSSVQTELASALFYFVFGAILATTVCGLTYISQMLYSRLNRQKADELIDRPWPDANQKEMDNFFKNYNKNSKWKTLGDTSNIIGTVFWLTSLSFFIYGCHIAGKAISSVIS